MKRIYLLATLDTKGVEIGYVQSLLEAQQLPVVVVDVGCQGEPAIAAQVTRQEVFAAAGTSLEAVRAAGDRGLAVTKAAEGAAELVAKHFAEGRVSGVLGIGGSAGTTIATAAMRRLPLGVPKVMVSTLASGDVRGFVGTKDIVMINPIVDILGLNRVTRTVLAEAAAAIAGMVRFAAPAASEADRPLVAATMFGVTTPCVERARSVLEENGYEVLVFHATGAGGEAMESLIRDGVIAGVLDITTTELADELVGGVLSAGPTRLTAAAETGVPQVVSVGATDMVNFWAMETVPAKFRERKLWKHNENVTLMRTTAEECAAIGADLARKVAASRGPAAVVLPLRGVSDLDHDGRPFDDPAARQALYQSIRENLRGVERIELDQHINDAPFAEAAARKLIELIHSH